MTIEKLMKIKGNTDAPFNHDEYTIWLHNKIIDDIKFELWNLREDAKTIQTNGYVICNKIFSLSSLKEIK